ncbi:Arm DNA-binding domain-containing protein [Burkholderia lata]|uniref:Arm DNA-binding domain-containing protein n=1 Tax=Burkholderia lata (strain ATCC 17760 / DSM 23089 / LMG 22485 / NCIMB 9086 / R18194 / 383) TaxID=482957 RepID=UPI00346480D5
MPIGHLTPFRRLLAFAGKCVSSRKKGVSPEVSFQASKDDTALFTAPLTDVTIRQAKAGSKPTKLTDGNGLYPLVNPSGSKLWRYEYRIAGKENLFAIGEYPIVSLQDARAARDGARELVNKGLHPSHARRKSYRPVSTKAKQLFEQSATSG